MYAHRRKFIGGGAVFFIVLFILVLIGSGFIYYTNKGIFWNYLLYVCIPSGLINLILLIFYFIRRNASGYIFLLFFLIFISGIVLSSFFGPFALFTSATDNYENKNYDAAILDFESLIEKYPGSKYTDESLKKLAFSNFLRGNYEDSVFYFDKAISTGLIDDKDLEIEKILVESNLKIAEKYRGKNDHEDAIYYYEKTVGYLKNIIKDSPDTNDAFIANYKIPEYLFIIALDYNEIEYWQRSIDTLNEILSGYPDSEYFDNSVSLLILTIMDYAEQLKKDGDNTESLNEFLKILDIEPDLRTNKAVTIQSRGRLLFENIPINTMIQTANEVYYSGEYEKAMFIYEYIILNLPEHEDKIVKNAVECKIKIIAENQYEKMPGSEPVGIFKKEGLASVSIENKTDYDIIRYMGGPEYKIISLQKQSKIDLEITPGSYMVATEIINSDIVPFYGDVDYEDGGLYREIYKLAEGSSEIITDP